MAEATQYFCFSVEKWAHCVQVNGVGIERIFRLREDQQRDSKDCRDEEHQPSGSL
jgi:hypothetical protein